jgi:hypothetical protein
VCPAQDVAEARAGVGRAILRDRLLLLGDLARLDRQAQAPLLLVDVGDQGVHLVADREPLGPLLAPVAAEVRLADEAAQVLADRDLDPAVGDRRHRAGDHRALAQLLRLPGRERVLLQLLDAKADALLLDVDVEHLGAHHVALLVVLDRLLAGPAPVEVREMDHPVELLVEADEQAELRDVLDLALHLAADRMPGEEGLPRILHDLLEAEADPPLLLVDLQHHHLDLLRGRDDLAGVHVLLGPAHLADVHQALDARLQLHEGAVVGDVGDAALELGAHRILGRDALPGIGLELLHAEADALRLGIDLDDLHLDGLADGQRFARMVDAPPRHVGDVQQPVDAAEIDEGAVVGDVLDHAVEHLALAQVGDELGALLRAGLLQHGAPRQHRGLAAAIHLEDLERLLQAHERPDVAHRADVDLAARQEGRGAVEVDGEAALDAADDRAFDALVLGVGDLQMVPRLLAPGLVARQHGVAQSVLDALEIDLDLVANLERLVLAGLGEFPERHPPFRLQPDVDDHGVVLDRHHDAVHDLALEMALGDEALLEHGLEIVGAVEALGRRCRLGHSNSSLRLLQADRLAPVVLLRSAGLLSTVKIAMIANFRDRSRRASPVARRR